MQSKATVEDYLNKHQNWIQPLSRFREILLKTELQETIKWGTPVYVLDGKNVVGIGAFKSYVGLWFFQGSFLEDSAKLLVNAQEGKTKALRQLRFSNEDEINYELIMDYIQEAIQNQKAGKEIKPNTNRKLVIPDELKKAFDMDVALKDAFYKFTLGKQREFTDHVAEAKQEATRNRRVQKIIPMIKDGIGLNDKYRKC